MSIHPGISLLGIAPGHKTQIQKDIYASLFIEMFNTIARIRFVESALEAQ